MSADGRTSHGIRVLTASLAVAGVVSGLVTYSTTQLGVVSIPLGQSAGLVSVYYLSKKESAVEITITGTRIAAPILVAAPAVLYFPYVLKTGNLSLITGGLSARGVKLGSSGVRIGGLSIESISSGSVSSVLGFIIWTVFFSLVGGAVYAFGKMLEWLREDLS